MGNYRQVPRLREQVPEHPPPHAEHGAVGAEVVVGAELGGEGVAGVAVGPAGTRILFKMGKHRDKIDGGAGGLERSRSCSLTTFSIIVNW